MPNRNKLFYFFFVGFILVLLFALFRACNTPLPPQEGDKKYLAMQSIIDSLKLENDSIKTVFVALDSVNTKLNEEKEKGFKKIIIINENKHEKIRTIAGFTNNQLFDFFAVRNIAPDSSYTR